MENKFYEISRRDLENIEILLDTDYDNDWMQLFFNHKNGYTLSQFNDEYDLNDDRHIRISAELAFKIWSMVEETDIKEVRRQEIQYRQKIDQKLSNN